MTEIEPEVEPHRVLNDVGRESMAFMGVGASIHSRILAQRRFIWQYLTKGSDGRFAEQGCRDCRFRATISNSRQTGELVHNHKHPETLKER